MATKLLIEKIQALPPERQTEVEDFVDFLARRPPIATTTASSDKLFSDDLLSQIDANREKLLREHGRFDSVPVIRELREHGT